MRRPIIGMQIMLHMLINAKKAVGSNDRFLTRSENQLWVTERSTGVLLLMARLC